MMTNGTGKAYTSSRKSTLHQLHAQSDATNGCEYKSICVCLLGIVVKFQWTGHTNKKTGYLNTVYRKIFAVKNFSPVA